MLQHNHLPQGRLRILETTDLHMHLLPYNYFADREDTSVGLMRMAGLIAQLRREAEGPVLLCDNGDFLQGNPMGDYIAYERGREDGDLQQGLRTTEFQLIVDALVANGGKRGAAAKGLGISPRTLRYKLARMREAGMVIPG